MQIENSDDAMLSIEEFSQAFDDGTILSYFRHSLAIAMVLNTYRYRQWVHDIMLIWFDRRDVSRRDGR